MDALGRDVMAEWYGTWRVPASTLPGHDRPSDAEIVNTALRGIAEFRYRLRVAGLREQALEDVACRVSRPQYRALQNWVASLDYRDPLVERVSVDALDGTMRVYGIVVIPR